MNRLFNYFIVCLTLLFFQTAGSVFALDVWLDKSGKHQIDAAYVGIDGKSVVLRKSDDTIVKVPIDRLSDRSRALAKAYYEKQKAAAKTSATVVLTDGTKLDSIPTVVDPKLDSLLPRYERWSVDFDADSGANYMALLDFFAFEPAYVDVKNSRVTSIAGTSSKKPKVSHHVPAKLDRLYFTQKKPIRTFQQAEEVVFKRAGLDRSNATTFNLMARQVENYLAKLESDYCRKNGMQITDVKESTFVFSVQDNQFDVTLTKVLKK